MSDANTSMPAQAFAPNATAPAQPGAEFNQMQQIEGEGADTVDVAFQPPVPQPRDYQLPSWQATQKGLQVDFAAEQEMRVAFHAAGVDQNLASSLYTAALHGVQQDLTPLSVANAYTTGERSLRAAWGDSFDANLKVANEEGRRLFEAMPESIRGDMSYSEFALVAGFANSAPIAKMLLARAQGRSRSSKTSR